MSRMRIAHFENHSQAEPARRFLLKEGIAAEIHAELGLAKLWFVSRCEAGVRLEVRAADAERATHLTRAEDEQSGVLRGATRCPECGSLRVDFPQFTRKSLLTNLVMGLLAEVRVLARAYYCEDCHFMWAKPGQEPQRARRHMAPNFFLEDLAGNARLPMPERPRIPAPAGLTQGSHLRLRKVWRKPLALALGCCLMSLQDDLRGAELVPLYASRSSRATAAGGSTQAQSPTYMSDVLPILMGKCGRCHNEQNRFLQNWLDYTEASRKRWEIKRRVWDSWHGDYFKQPMPTDNSPESQAITEEERTIIRNWAETGAAYGVAPVLGGAQTKSEKVEAGKRLFTTICAACHQPSGLGIPGRFPPLAGSDFLNADKHRAIGIVVNGLQGEVVVNGQKFNNSMPKFPLSDQDIACALTYVYGSFGNSGKEVTPEEVRRVRGEQNALLPMARGQPAGQPEEKSPFE